LLKQTDSLPDGKEDVAWQPDVIGQHPGTAVVESDGEEVGPARDIVASEVNHETG
jgi:hypothetical protein